MQAVIMAGGKGTRLWELTHNEIPKPMAPIKGKPLLEWQIECLKRNGISSVIMVIGHLGNVIREYFGGGSKHGISITYFEETTPLGTAGALGQLEDRLEENFLLVFGDILFDVDIQRMVKFHSSNGSLATLYVHPNGHPFDSDLVIVDQESKVVKFDSKHNERMYWYKNCVNAGLYVMRREICQYIPKSGKTDLEKEVLASLCGDTGRVYAYRSPEYVKDVGTVERIRSATKDLDSGLVAARNLGKPQKAIFLDRDGTINVKKGLVYEENQFELEKNAADAIRLINQSGYLAIVITNQPVVARGLCGIDDVNNIHMKMETLLGMEGAYLDDILFCPHHPDKGYPEENPVYKISCHCRKPDTGLIEECVKRYNISLRDSWVVGDTTIDIQTGVNAGTKTALVLTGDAGEDRKYDVSPDVVEKNLVEAVNTILNQ